MTILNSNLKNPYNFDSKNFFNDKDKSVLLFIIIIIKLQAVIRQYNTYNTYTVYHSAEKNLCADLYHKSIYTRKTKNILTYTSCLSKLHSTHSG